MQQEQQKNMRVTKIITTTKGKSEKERVLHKYNNRPKKKTTEWKCHATRTTTKKRKKAGDRPTTFGHEDLSLPVHCSMDTDVPFSRWDGDRVTAWMNEIGLNMYLGECKRWVRNGEQLLKASVHDLEKVRHPWKVGAGDSIALKPNTKFAFHQICFVHWVATTGRKIKSYP